MAKGKDNPGNPQIIALVDEVRGHNQRLDEFDKRLAVVENDTGWIKRQVRGLDAKVWMILTGVIVTILLTLR